MHVLNLVTQLVTSLTENSILSCVGIFTEEIPRIWFRLENEIIGNETLRNNGGYIQILRKSILDLISKYFQSLFHTNYTQSSLDEIAITLIEFCLAVENGNNYVSEGLGLLLVLIRLHDSLNEKILSFIPRLFQLTAPSQEPRQGYFFSLFFFFFLFLFLFFTSFFFLTFFLLLIPPQALLCLEAIFLLHPHQPSLPSLFGPPICHTIRQLIQEGEPSSQLIAYDTVSLMILHFPQMISVMSLLVETLVEICLPSGLFVCFVICVFVYLCCMLYVVCCIRNTIISFTSFLIHTISLKKAKPHQRDIKHQFVHVDVNY
jgi:septum formation topological specificity factor MinE